MLSVAMASSDGFRLSQRIAELECSEQVVLLGFRNDVPRLLRTAAVLVLSSVWEGLPNVVLEAQAAGLPVIASDVEGIREVIEPGVNGIIVEPGNAAELQNAVRQLMSSPERRLAMRVSLQAILESLLTTQSATQKYVDLYRRLLKTGDC